MARQSEFYELRLGPLSEAPSEGYGPGVQENRGVAQRVPDISVNDDRYPRSTGGEATVKVDDYAVFDVGGRYSTKVGDYATVLRLTVDNLFDKR